MRFFSFISTCALVLIFIGAGISLLGVGYGLYIGNKGLVKMGLENALWTTVLYLEYRFFIWLGRATDEEQDKTDPGS